MRRVAATVGSLLIATTGVAGCGLVEDSTSSAASSATCLAINQLEGQVASVGQQAADGATAADLKRQAQVLRTAAEGVSATIGSLAPEVSQAFQQAARAFHEGVQALPADASPQVTDAVVTQAADAYRQAMAAAESSLGC